MARIIGIKHRVKEVTESELGLGNISKKVELRPTKVAIREGEKLTEYDLKTEGDELDFLLCKFPVSWRDADSLEDVSAMRQDHIKWRKLDAGEEVPSIHASQMRQQSKKVTEVAVKVPEVYEGFRKGDTVAMMFGGSGSRFMYALSRRGEEIGAQVMAIPPDTLQKRRGQAPKTDDHMTLVGLVCDATDLFKTVGPRERRMVRVAVTLRDREEAQDERIKCQLRIYSNLVGRIFLNADGRYPEGSIDEQFKLAKANSERLARLLQDEKACEKELKDAVHQLEVWHELFASEEFEGCGEVIAAKIIAPIVDILRFPGPNQLNAFLGGHVALDGRFPRNRRRNGAEKDPREPEWHREARQALWLLADQFNRRPNSPWGQKLLEVKRNFREKHPEVVEFQGKNGIIRMYTNGHILKMAKWRTVTKWVKQALFRQWTEIELRHRREHAVLPTAAHAAHTS